MTGTSYSTAAWNKESPVFDTPAYKALLKILTEAGWPEWRIELLWLSVNS